MHVYPPKPLIVQKNVPAQNQLFLLKATRTQITNPGTMNTSYAVSYADVLAPRGLINALAVELFYRTPYRLPYVIRYTQERRKVVFHAGRHCLSLGTRCRFVHKFLQHHVQLYVRLLPTFFSTKSIRQIC